MASHEELVLELPKLEKMSNAARLKLAKKRRLKQLKQYQDTVRRERETGQLFNERTQFKIDFINDALLHEAVIRNDLKEVENLLTNGVNSNPSNADGLTPIHRCCIENTLDMATLLVEYNADLNARDIEGWTPLHAASACGNLSMINLLIDHGASLVAVNHDDKMPVDVACDSDIRYVLQQKMLEAGYTDDVCKYIRASVPKTMLADLKDSIKSNRSVNIQDKYGATALHVASANGYLDVLEFILQQPDIKVNIQDNEGWTPFHAAVCWEQKEAMKMLAEKGANLEMQDIHGDTPFAVSDNPEIRQYIIDLKTEFSIRHTDTIITVEQTGENHLRKPSMEDLMESSEYKGRNRSMSARRTSTVDKDDVKRMSSRMEKIMRDTTLGNEDMDRIASGDTMNDEELTCLMDDDKLQSSTGGISLEPISNCTSQSPDVQESSFGRPSSAGSNQGSGHGTTGSTSPHTPNDGTLNFDDEIEAALDGRNDRRRKPKSVLKNSNPSPVLTDHNLSTTTTKSDSFREKRPSTSSNGRNCCVIL